MSIMMESTEKELIEILHIDKIWDCGKIKWIWNKKGAFKMLPQ